MTPPRSVPPEDIRNRCESCCTVRVVTDAVESTTSSRFLAIDLSPSRLAAGVVDARGEVLVRDRVATPARHMWPTLTRLVSRVLAAAPDDIVPTACGVSCVGPVDHDRGSMEPIGLPLWRGFPLRDELSEITGMHVTVDTSGRALALAERWCGDLAGADNFVALLIGDYVDGGVVLGGRLLGGANGNLGQVGHVQVEPEGAECFCGAHGCLDVYAGGRAIEAATNRPLTRAPEVIIERAGLMVGRAAASLAAALDVVDIVVAGSVPTVFGQPFFEAVKVEIAQRSRLPHLSGLTVRAVGVANRSPLVGAAALARHHQAVSVAPTGDEDPGPGTTGG